MILEFRGKKDKTRDKCSGKNYIQLALQAMGVNELMWGEEGKTEKRPGRHKYQTLGQSNTERWIEKERKVRRLKRSSHCECGVREATKSKHFKVGGLSSLTCCQEGK